MTAPHHPLGRRARALESIRGAGEVVPIGIAKDGVVRIRGTVRALPPVDDLPTIEELARQSIGPSHGPERRRFAVVDSSGVAVVDDDHVEVWSTETDSDVPVHAGAAITEGASVTVVGAGRLVAATDAAPLVAASYREAPKALLLEGRPDAPLLVLVRG